MYSGLSSKHGTLYQYWFDVRPASQTVAQHQTSIVLIISARGPTLDNNLTSTCIDIRF